MDNLLNPLEDPDSSVEQPTGEGKDGEAPVPKVARLLRDGQGKFMYVGDSASLSFLQSVRRIVSSSIGRCEFTDDTSRHSMLEASQSNSSIRLGSLAPPPNSEEAQQLARQYVLATSPLLDLFDLDEFYARLATWVTNTSGDADTVSSIYYLVLAIGAQVSNTDQTLAEQYFVSGRQLAFSAFTETPSIYTIQSYVLISMYMLGACRRNGAFMNLGIALRAAYAVGMHRKDANAVFNDRERRARERVWKSLRTVDLFLSASLGRPPATSDHDSDVLGSADNIQSSPPDEQVSVAVTSLCHIFERILTNVYMKQVVSIKVAESISNQHRAWVRNLPTILKSQTDHPGSKTLEETLTAAHVLGSYYWSIVLLTRPFLIYRVSQYVKNKTAESNEPKAGNSRIALFADACVYSALRGLDTIDGLSQFHSLPRRLPFLINSAFNAAIVLGAAFFADYDNLLPLQDGMTKADRFLELFVPHDPHACRFLQIIKYLRASVAEHVRRRNRQWIDRRSRQVDQLFGQLAPSAGTGTADSASPSGPSIETLNAQTAPSPLSPSKLSNPPSYPQPQHQPPSTDPTLAADHNIWDTLCPAETPPLLYLDTATSALTTTGVPINSPGDPIFQGQFGADPQTQAQTQTPLSDMLVSDNGLFYMAEGLNGFGLWGEET